MICFCELTPEFLKYPSEDRHDWVPKWRRVASKHGVDVLFWRLPMGVSEHVGLVFEVKGSLDKYFLYQRDWLGYGTPEACRHIKNTRTIQVY